MILVNTEFLPVLEGIRDRIEPVKKLVLLNDADQPPATSLNIDAEYESLLAASDPHYPFPDLSEDTRATTFLHHRHHRPAQGRVFQPPATGVAYLQRDDSADRGADKALAATMCICRSPRCSTSTLGASPISPR